LYQDEHDQQNIGQHERCTREHDHLRGGASAFGEASQPEIVLLNERTDRIRDAEHDCIRRNIGRTQQRDQHASMTDKWSLNLVSSTRTTQCGLAKRSLSQPIHPCVNNSSLMRGLLKNRPKRLTQALACPCERVKASATAAS